MARIGIIYVPFRNKRHFAEVVDAWALLNYPKEQLTIYIVPNSDPEGLFPEIERIAREVKALGLPEVKILADGVNHGFAGNHNIGIEEAIKDGCDFVYLNNGDLKLDPDALTEAVAVIEKDADIAAVQSLMLYWHEPEKVNVAGGIIHIAGYGYGIGNGQLRKDVVVENGMEIGYASGGAVLYRTVALKKVGLLEDGFFMYHEDLELGLRLRVAGYKNVLATKSLAYHDYTFAINEGMFHWMETNRYLVLFAYLRPLTLLLIAPVLLGVECATWFFALRGGWLKAKISSALDFLKPKTWKLMIYMRMRMKHLRRIPDHVLIRDMTGVIEAQEQANWIVDRVANPVLAFYVRVLKRVVFW